MNNITHWTLVNVIRWLLPLLVIYILFIVFKELSYFDFISRDTNQAIRYGGPVGAYIFLFWLGNQLIPKFEGRAEKSDTTANYKDLLGEWEVISNSNNLGLTRNCVV